MRIGRFPSANAKISEMRASGDKSIRDWSSSMETLSLPMLIAPTTDGRVENVKFCRQSC